MPIIEVEGLVKRYRKAARNAVDGISFSVEAGEQFALLGPNGAGKTTTISILSTTLAPTAGKVSIAGYDLATQGAAIRSQVGIIRVASEPRATGRLNRCLKYQVTRRRSDGL